MKGASAGRQILRVHLHLKHTCKVQIQLQASMTSLVMFVYCQSSACTLAHTYRQDTGRLPDDTVHGSCHVLHYLCKVHERTGALTARFWEYAGRLHSNSNGHAHSCCGAVAEPTQEEFQGALAEATQELQVLKCCTACLDPATLTFSPAVAAMTMFGSSVLSP